MSEDIRLKTLKEIYTKVRSMSYGFYREDFGELSAEEMWRDIRMLLYREIHPEEGDNGISEWTKDHGILDHWDKAIQEEPVEPEVFVRGIPKCDCDWAED